MMICTKCGEDKPPDSFYRDPRRQAGHSSHCRKCNRAYKTDRWRANPNAEREKNRLYRSKSDAKLRERFPLLLLFRAVRSRAALKGLDMNLTAEYLEDLWRHQHGKCALSGVQMLTGSHEALTDVCHAGVSIDRIDPAKGYVVGNIQLVQSKVNIAKNRMTDEEFVQMCREVVEHADRMKGE